MHQWGILALTLALLTGCGTANLPENLAADQTTAPLAVLEGEELSPDGQFEVQIVGASNIVNGIQVPEKIQVVDQETGEVMWEDQGWGTQSVLWSPDSHYLALAYGACTWQAVHIIETDTWTVWDFTLPDGSPIPEHVALPHDQPWGVWEKNFGMPEEDYALILTVGRGGDREHTYHCSFLLDGGHLIGNPLEQTSEVLSDRYGFDHDGTAERTELVTLWEPEREQAAWYKLQVTTADGGLLWSQTAAEYHVGWTSVFAYREDGTDYLLRYNPWMGQGNARYHYQIFSLDRAGQESILREHGVEFDINFGSPVHESFDAIEIAAFLEETHGYLNDSTLLVTTEGGTLRTGGSGAEFQEDMEFWNESCPYEETKFLEDNLRNYEAWATKNQK